jgi:hypothetical protein
MKDENAPAEWFLDSNPQSLRHNPTEAALGIVSRFDVPLLLLPSDFDETAGFPSRPGGLGDFVALQPVSSREVAITSAARERPSRGI